MASTKKSARKAVAEHQVWLSIVCQRPPDPGTHGAEFGLQDNSTTKDWVIHSGQVQPTGDIHFDCACRVLTHQKTGAPNFLGTFVHGAPTERFLYLSWRPKGWKPGQAEASGPTWVRRMKIHLRTITWDQIRTASRGDRVLEVAVAGTGRDGGPSCASVALVGGGWKVKTQA
jgi:hypothetical protein